MTDTHQIQQDLHYVREVVSRLEQPRRRPVAIYWVWAIYVLITYPLADFTPHLMSRVSLIGIIICFALSGYLGYRIKKSAGVRPAHDRSGLFWTGGGLMIVFSLAAMQMTIPQMRSILPGGAREEFVGQMALIMVGLFYFLGGVHYDRNFLWLGPLLCICGLFVGLVPHYGWTAMGIIFALGLIGPTLFPPRPPVDSQQINPA